MVDFVVVIPSRFSSLRLPGKPLQMIGDRTMLQRVYERGQASGATRVIIATDDQRIVTAAESFSAECILTSSTHRSGTDRLAEVANTLEFSDEQIIVNLQGDEPFMPPANISQCADLLAESTANIGTLASPMESMEAFGNPNVVKVVVDRDDNAIYFGRARIPFPRDERRADAAHQAALHHHGIYSYRNKDLQTIVQAEPAVIEQVEQLEQLRALWLGMTIRVAVPQEKPGPGIDTEEDLAEARKRVENE